VAKNVWSIGLLQLFCGSLLQFSKPISLSKAKNLEGDGNSRTLFTRYLKIEVFLVITVEKGITITYPINFQYSL